MSISMETTKPDQQPQQQQHQHQHQQQEHQISHAIDGDDSTPTVSEVLVKKVFPYLALACIPILSSTNAVMTRAAYTIVPEGKEVLHPFTLACLRMYQAFFCFLIARWWRNEIMLKKFSQNAAEDEHDDGRQAQFSLEEEETRQSDIVNVVLDDTRRMQQQKEGHGESKQQSEKHNEEEAEDDERLQATAAYVEAAVVEAASVPSANATAEAESGQETQQNEGIDQQLQRQGDPPSPSKIASTKTRLPLPCPAAPLHSHHNQHHIRQQHRTAAADNVDNVDASTKNSDSNTSSSSSRRRRMHTISEAHTKPGSIAVNVLQSLSRQDQRRHQMQLLRNPVRFSLALMDVGQAWLLGLLTVANIFLFVVGIQYTDGTTTAAFLSSMPSMTFVIGYALGYEKYSHAHAIATVLILVGNILMSHLWRLVNGDVVNGDGKHGARYYVGALMLFLSCLAGSAYFVLQRPLSKRMSFLDFFVHMYGFAAAVAWIASLFPRENILTAQLLSGLYPTAWAAIFVGGVLQCFVGFLLFAFVSNFIGSSVVVTLFRASAPVLIVVESIVFLGETLDRYQVYGAIAILAGIGLTMAPLMMSGGSLVTSPSAAEGQQKKDDAVELEAQRQDDVTPTTPATRSYDDVTESILVVTPTTIMPSAISKNARR